MTPDEYIKNVVKTESVDFDAIADRLSNPHLIRLLHGAIGMATEAGELLDQLKKHIFYGKELDEINLVEELGDSDWYKGIIVDELQTSFEHIWKLNIEKLKKRYGNKKFAETKALGRDLDAERKILEEDE